jgi:hypothetical protein
MACPPPKLASHFVKFGKTVIPPELLYDPQDDPSYGYETEFHVTAKYGFIPDLTKQDVAGILRDIKPFFVTLTGISAFNNAEFDVIKFDVQLDDILNKIRQRSDEFPNEDSHPDYRPHGTIGYVLPGKLSISKTGLNIKVPITRFKYTGGTDNNKYYINL